MAESSDKRPIFRPVSSDQTIELRGRGPRHGQDFTGDFGEYWSMSEAIEITDALLAELPGMIVEAQVHVARVANPTLTMLFWRIGQRIHCEILREKHTVYGKQIVAGLRRHLTAEFDA